MFNVEPDLSVANGSRGHTVDFVWYEDELPIPEVPEGGQSSYDAGILVGELEPYQGDSVIGTSSKRVLSPADEKRLPDQTPGRRTKRCLTYPAAIDADIRIYG